jgi:hypothetical protein
MSTFTFTIGDSNKRISVKGLTTALEKVLELLRSLELDIGGPSAGLRWEIAHISMSSPLTVTYAPIGKTKANRDFGKEVIKACVHGLGEIERKTDPKMPQHFNYDSLTSAKELLQVANKEGMAIAIAPERKKPIVLTEHATKRIDELVTKVRRYKDVLTLEGNLEMISVHDHLSFFMWETLTNYKIECFIGDELLNKCIELLKKRIAVSGEVSYRDHIPKSIKVESIRELRDKRQLPQPSTMKPINITDGLSSEDHVRRMRDG